MKDGPHTNSLEQAGLAYGIIEPGKFQEIRVSIQVMINRWPGKLRCPDKRTPPADRRILTMPKTGDQETEGHLLDDVAREFNVSTQGDTLS